MGDPRARLALEGDHRRVFIRRVLEDLRALEEILASGLVESGVRRVGAEQEMFLVDRGWRPAPLALELLRELGDPHFTTELGLFNLEINLDPLEFGGGCLRRLEEELRLRLDQVRRAAEGLGALPVITGILPTLRKSDLGLEYMTPKDRYRALNHSMSRMRGGAYEFKIRGQDELIVRHDSVMVEACNASFQVHFQVGADEFAPLYNIAQAVAGPVLAAATNSPLLFGRRLWRETRIALFQQAVDTRSSSEFLRERSPRVTFGNRWVQRSVLELFREDIARFRALVGTEDEEDPFDALARGEAPELAALRVHNSTVYRWNRACYGVTNGRPHLRIENRIFPAGPTPADQVANAAFWFGLIGYFSREVEDVTRLLRFEQAANNFHLAARLGLAAEMTWFEDREIPARKLILDHLLPAAREGLEHKGIDSEDADRYLGILEHRVRSGQTGSEWILKSLDSMGDRGSLGERLNALVAAMSRREPQDLPVSRWALARLDESGGWQHNYRKVEQFMNTDLYTVHADEPLDLVANLMEWERIRHVPVEDDQHRLVGLVSYRTLLRLLARGQGPEGARGLPVSEVMIRDPVTVHPETPTLEAIEVMRRRQVGCLPVVKDGKLVGMITERDFMNVAREMIEDTLRLGAPGEPREAEGR